MQCFYNQQFYASIGSKITITNARYIFLEYHAEKCDVGRCLVSLSTIAFNEKSSTLQMSPQDRLTIDGSNYDHFGTDCCKTLLAGYIKKLQLLQVAILFYR